MISAHSFRIDKWLEHARCTALWFEQGHIKTPFLVSIRKKIWLSLLCFSIALAFEVAFECLQNLMDAGLNKVRWININPAVWTLLCKELFEYMLMVSAATIDEYNDKFLMIAKGMISFEQFLESES